MTAVTAANQMQTQSAPATAEQHQQLEEQEEQEAEEEEGERTSISPELAGCTALGSAVRALNGLF